MNFEKLYAAMQQKKTKLGYSDIIQKTTDILVTSLNTIYGSKDCYKYLSVKKVIQNTFYAVEFHCNNECILGVIVYDNGKLLVDLNPTTEGIDPVEVRDDDKEHILTAVTQIIEDIDKSNFTEAEGILHKDGDKFKDDIVKLINTLSDVPYTSKYDDLKVYGIKDHYGFFVKDKFILSIIFKKNGSIVCTKDITSNIGSGEEITGVSKALANKLRDIVESKTNSDSIQIISEQEALHMAAKMLADLVIDKMHK